ncbi:MAG TPA: FtsW/RodA/SpoVE family cell cycle protein [Bacilli bacterium]
MLVSFRKIDWTIVAILFLFMIISSVLIYSATYNTRFFSSHLYIKNILNYVLGFLVFFGMILVDYRILLKTSLYSYLFGILMLIAVYFFGVEINGARSWFELPLGFNFQPAELMKIILIVAIAKYISRKEGEHLELVRDIMPIGGIVLLPFMLVLIQPDLGNAIIYLVILVGMLWIGNIKYSYVLIGLAAFAAFLALFLFLYGAYHQQLYGFLEKHHSEHWMDRIDTFLHPESVSNDDAYQVNNAKIAIGSGELHGEGFLRGNSVHSRVPLPFSDSIFAVIGEEFGFIGSSVLLVLYFLLIYRLILTAIQCSDLSGAIIIFGIVSMFVFQIFENVGMLIGIMPLTGITLPFVSYGGTSVLINMLSLGLVLSIKVHQEELPPF